MPKVADASSLLDPEVLEVLSSMDAFFFQQRVRLVEAGTCGCCEQPNVYDVFHHETKQRIMIMKEESDTCSRLCCKPGHSVFVKFYLVGKDAPELKPGQNVDWSYEPTSPPFMTFEREGCDCCFKGLCPKPFLGCFAGGEGCRETGTLHAGELTGRPGEMHGGRDRNKLLGESIQPPGGGGFKPVMQMMERADPSDHEGKTELFAATRGPCCTGGCSKLCFSSEFEVGPADSSMMNDSSRLHQVPFGQFSAITKMKPKSMKQGLREFFTDSDLFDVVFANKSVTPQQKATTLAQMVHLDYMFFERDNDICHRNPDGSTSIVFANCFMYGCICPCQLVLKKGN